MFIPVASAAAALHEPNEWKVIYQNEEIKGLWINWYHLWNNHAFKTCLSLSFRLERTKSAQS